jgi:uncharacterized protein
MLQIQKKGQRKSQRKRMSKMKTALFLLATLFLSTSASAASFNCRYAKSPVEVAICQTPRLEGFDELVSKMYFGLQDDVSPREFRSVKAAQSRFLARRDRCGYNENCIARTYDNRISELCAFADRRGINCYTY